MARALLILAGTFSAAISLLHFAIPVLGAPAYRYFGAGEEIALRGLSFVPQAALWLQDPGLLPGRHVIFSFVALAAGVSYLAGTLAGWRALSVQGK